MQSSYVGKQRRVAQLILHVFTGIKPALDRDCFRAGFLAEEGHSFEEDGLDGILG